MTIRLSLDPWSASSSGFNNAETEAEAGPSTPRASSFAQSSPSRSGDLEEVVRCLRESKRIVVVSGAGVSTGTGIPDFRSSSGLFSDSNGKGKGKGKAVQDLFHVRCLSSPALLAEHQTLISSLATLSHTARPTPFHRFLRTLDEDGRLSRCYTQNIDGLEEKVGLRVGIPIPLKRSQKGRRKAVASASASASAGTRPDSSSSFSKSPAPALDKGLTDVENSPTLPLPLEFNVIPLHGLLTSLHCPLCHTSVPLASHLPLPFTPVPCPTCELSTTIRHALSERKRRMGHLRASVVLYGEEHPQGELIGAAIERDLNDSRPDCLLVVGTSLSVPGVKKLVKDMAKRVKSIPRSKSKAQPNRPAHTPNRKVKVKVEEKGTVAGQGDARPRSRSRFRTVYINNEPPSKASEWKDVFDIWVQGDVQAFVSAHLGVDIDDRSRDTSVGNVDEDESASSSSISNKTGRPPSLPSPPSTPTTPKKRQCQSHHLVDREIPPTPESIGKTARTRTGTGTGAARIPKSKSQVSTPNKKRKLNKASDLPLTPESLPHGRERDRQRRGLCVEAEAEGERSVSPSPTGHNYR